jgi:phosphonate transport system permease protein
MSPVNASPVDGASGRAAKHVSVPGDPKRSWASTFGWIAVIAVLGLSWQSADMRPLDLIRDSGNMAQFGRDFFPPDFTEWRAYVHEMIVTLAVAVWGTALALVCAVPCGLLSASNIAPLWVTQPVRRVMDAMLFIVAVGLGPFAGVLALWVHTTGVLAKLFAEAVEAIDARPAEGVRATGASTIDEIVYGVLPQVMPLWISFALYRFESNVRSAMVVGMVGAGGIGVVIYEAIRSFNYAQTAAVMLMVIVIVTLIDLGSAWVRERVI